MRTVGGMTLLEVMVASAALCIGIFSVFAAMGTSSQVRHRARYQGMAVEAIQSQIERLQAMSYNNVAASVPAAGGMAFDVIGLRAPQGQSQPGSIVRENDSTGTRLHLRFTVDWVDAGGPASVVVYYHHVNRGG